MTDETDLKNLAKESEKTDLGILITAKEESKRRVMDDPNPSNLTAYDKATKMLSEHLESEKEPVFENRIEVLKYLNRQGYAIQKTKLYADSNKGLLKLQPDKTILESDVKAYIRRAGLEKPADLSGDAGKEDLLISRRREMEIKKLEEQVAELEFKRQVTHGLYVLKTDFELEIAARIAVFDVNLRHFFQSMISDWISQAEGNLKKIPILLESINKHLDEQFNAFASMKTFQVIIMENENDAGT